MNGCMQTTEIQIKSTTHLNYRTVTKDQTAIDCISSDKRKYNFAQISNHLIFDVSVPVYVEYVYLNIIIINICYFQVRRNIK